MNFKVQTKATGLDKAIKDLTAISDRQNSNVASLLQMMTDDGKKIAEDTIGGYDAIETGELINSVKSEVNSVLQEGYIWATSEHAKYVEFGTGIIGKNNASPSAIYNGWIYDINMHGEKGWTYNKNGRFYHTKGMGARPFMYNTAYQLKNDIKKYAREAWKK